MKHVFTLLHLCRVHPDPSFFQLQVASSQHVVHVPQFTQVVQFQLVTFLARTCSAYSKAVVFWGPEKIRGHAFAVQSHFAESSLTRMKKKLQCINNLNSRPRKTTRDRVFSYLFPSCFLIFQEMDNRLLKSATVITNSQNTFQRICVCFIW